MSNDRKVSVISGASQGIGAGPVTAYRTRGYSVIAGSLSIAPSTDPDVNDTGLFISKPFSECTAEDYATMVGVNLTRFFYIAQAAISDMERRGSGHIVRITTSLVAHASSAIPSVLASLTEGGLDAATRSLAIEYATRGIRVNAVSPGVIKASMRASEIFEALGHFHPIGHMGEISDVVDTIMYLEQAPLVIGETLHVDGGQSAGD